MEEFRKGHGIEGVVRLDGTSEEQPSRRNDRNKASPTRLLKFESTSYLILPFSIVNRRNILKKKKDPIKVEVLFSTRPPILHLFFGQVEQGFCKLTPHL